MIDELLKLSKIFKQGFTVELKEGKLSQYTNYDKPFIVSYLTIIKITDNSIDYSNLSKIPSNCIIGGWSNEGIYFIEVNKAFSSIYKAEHYAIIHKQKAFYNIRTGKTVKPRYEA